MSRVKTQKGFTLLEILVVLLLLSLTASITIFALSRAEKKQALRLTVKEIVLFIKEARAKAILKQMPIKVQLSQDETNPNSLIMTNLSGQKLKTYHPARGITVQMQATLVLFPTGSSSGGSIHLTDGKTSYTIEVDEVTGIARFQKQ